MEDERTAEDKLHEAETMLNQALRVVGILTHRAGGEVTLTDAEMITADYYLETSLDVESGAMTIRAAGTRG